MELGIAYELTGPDLTRVVFGNCDAAKFDPDFIGWLDPENGITGLLDGADVRTTEQAIVEGDGLEQGPSFLAGRPGTIQGVIDPNVAIGEQERRIRLVKRASNALRADAVLRWTPSEDGVRRRMRLRRSARPAFPGRRPKTFQLAMSCPDAYVYSDSEVSLEIPPAGPASEAGISDPISDPITSDLNVVAQLLVENLGDAPTWPRFRVDGPITNPEILLVDADLTQHRIRLNYTLAVGEWLDIYPERGVVLLNGTADRYSAYDFALSEWWQLKPSTNDVRLTAVAYDAGAKLTVYWRHSWQ